MPHPESSAPPPPRRDLSPGAVPEPPPGGFEAWYRALFDAHPTPLLLYDVASLRLLDANAAAVRQYGYPREELIGMPIADLRPAEDVPILLAQLATATRDGVRHGVFRHRRRDGSLFHVRITSHPVEAGGRSARLISAEDVSEREVLEQQLRQAQKMEAVGRLAGGMAHDFNNLLTTILATCELMAGVLAPDSDLRADLETIRGAATRGTKLTAKLLAFSRRKPLEIQPLDLDALLGEFSRLLRRLVPESVEIKLSFASAGAAAKADPGAVEEIVMNLVTNACDAMPGGGELEIRTARATLDHEFCLSRPGSVPGAYVALAVRDNGGGMDEATLRRLFEPFFTTKPVGEGTGLGMAMVYGLVKQQGGYVDVASRRRAGTTVTVYLPETSEAARAPDAPPAAARPGGAGQVILLVEDEPPLRRAATRVLSRSGYAVLSASDGREALELLDRGERVDLVITDMVMPRLGGSDLVRELRERGRGIRVLVTSGYPGRGGEPPAEVPAGTHFLAKPWTIEDLLAAVRGALAAPPPDGATSAAT